MTIAESVTVAAYNTIAREAKRRGCTWFTIPYGAQVTHVGDARIGYHRTAASKHRRMAAKGCQAFRAVREGDGSANYFAD